MAERRGLAGRPPLLTMDLTKRHRMADEPILPKHRPVKAGGRDTPGIYVIRNTISGRVYVGSSYQINSRWRSHRKRLRKGNHHSTTLQRSWNKHGEKAFLFEIVEVVWNEGNLFPREQYWIDRLNSSDPQIGFNMHSKVGGGRGYRFSDEARALMSETRKGRKMPPFTQEHREGLRRAKLGTKVPEETRAKWSAARKGKKRPPFSEAHKLAISAGKKGSKMSMEARAHLSYIRTGKLRGPFSMVHRIAISNARKSMAAKKLRNETQLELFIYQEVATAEELE